MADLPNLQASRVAIISSLSRYLGQRIDQICPYYNDLHFNHCAHFVSHALQIRIPHSALCTNVGENADYSKRNEGFCVRVNQVFNSCSNRRMWSDQDQNDRCFVVATVADNVTSKKSVTIGDNPKKHVGVLISGKIINFSNQNKLVMNRTIDEFRTLYGPKTVLLASDPPI
jgi:hypothetical protein